MEDERERAAKRRHTRTGCFFSVLVFAGALWIIGSTGILETYFGPLATVVVLVITAGFLHAWEERRTGR